MKIGNLTKQEAKYIKDGIRKAFRFGPNYKDWLNNARIESPRYLKNGKIGLIPRVEFKCAKCEQLFPRKGIQVDHIHCCVPPTKREADMDIVELIQRTLYGECQVMCKKCHLQKTTKENKQRRLR